MSEGRKLLLDLIKQNKGKRTFSKSTNHRLLEILVELAQSGVLEVAEDTPESITYRVSDRTDD